MISRRRAHRGRYLAPVVAVVLGVMVLGVMAPVVPAAGAPTPSPSPSGGKASPAAPPAARWSVAPANATGPDGRTRYSYEGLKPGATVHDYVSITNLGDKPVTFRVYAADGITTSDGSVGVATADAKPTDVGAWTHLTHGSVQVAARARVVEPFTIAVPANAAPGDHVGGVIASIREQVANGQVSRESRFAVAAYLRVTGALTASLGIESVSTSYQGTINPFGGGAAIVGYTVRIIGNVRLAGGQSVSVTGPLGIGSTMRPPALEQLLPGDSVRVTARVPGLLPGGPMNAQVTVNPVPVSGAPSAATALVPASRSVSLWATPWPQLVVLLVLIAIAAGLWWSIRASRRRVDARIAAAEARGRRARTRSSRPDPD